MAEAPLIRPAFFTFLKELEANNKRDWFKANQARYEEDVREPARALIRALAPGLRKVSPHMGVSDAKVGGSLFRIQRDTRFSPDKTPYKTYIAMRFHTMDQGPKGEAVGCYVSFSNEGCYAAAGLYGGSTPVLNQVRDHIVEHEDDWARLRDQGIVLEEGEALKTAPRGYDADHPLIDDLRRKQFFTATRLAKKDVTSARLPDVVLQEFDRTAPLNRFLADAIGLAW